MNSFNTANLCRPPSTLKSSSADSRSTLTGCCLSSELWKEKIIKTTYLGHTTETVDRNCTFHHMTAVMILLVKFWGTPCTAAVWGKPQESSWFFPWSQLHMSSGADTRASPHAGSWTVEWHLPVLLPHFPLEGTAPLIYTILHFPHSW